VLKKRTIRMLPLVALLAIASGGGTTAAHASDDTARFYGTWETAVPYNGKMHTLVSVHDAGGYHNHFRLPGGDAPAGEGEFSAANGRYTAVAPKPNDSGTYVFMGNDTVACTNSAGQTAVWQRVKATESSVAGAGVPPAAPVTPAARATPAAPAYDPSLPAETNAAIAAFSRGDYATAWRNFMAAAQKGDAEAEAGVGAMLFKKINPPGTGYYAQCEQWLLSSANKGNTKGMGFLAQYYYASAVSIAGGINPGINNAPIPPALRQQAEARFALARQWFERAADKGDVYAMGNLAAMLDSGIGGPRDPTRAAALRAQVKGGPDANFAHRATADPAGMALNASWQAGHYADAVKQATELANAGNPRAEALLARAYYQGKGVAVDDHAAFHWAQRAANANDPDGLYFLGQCYENSRGVARNLTKASDLYDRAIELGQLDARAARSGIDYILGKGRSPAGGPQFCNKGTSDTMGGCVGESGKMLDPTTGKPTDGS
jgi:TPR repeat protein